MDTMQTDREVPPTTLRPMAAMPRRISRSRLLQQRQQTLTPIRGTTQRTIPAIKQRMLPWPPVVRRTVDRVPVERVRMAEAVHRRPAVRPARPRFNVLPKQFKKL